MAANLREEQWKRLAHDFKITNNGYIEVSNLGRLRSFNKISDGNILNGSMINGYKILRPKLYTPRDPKMQQKLDYLQQQVFKLQRKLKAQNDANKSKKVIADTSDLLNQLKADLSKKFEKDL